MAKKAKVVGDSVPLKVDEEVREEVKKEVAEVVDESAYDQLSDHGFRIKFVCGLHPSISHDEFVLKDEDGIVICSISAPPRTFPILV